MQRISHHNNEPLKVFIPMPKHQTLPRAIASSLASERDNRLAWAHVASRLMTADAMTPADLLAWQPQSEPAPSSDIGTPVSSAGFAMATHPVEADRRVASELAREIQSPYTFRPFSFSDTADEPVFRGTHYVNNTAVDSGQIAQAPMVAAPTDLFYDKAQQSSGNAMPTRRNQQPMVDLSTYQDLTSPPTTEQPEKAPAQPAPAEQANRYESKPNTEYAPMNSTPAFTAIQPSTHPEILEHQNDIEIYAEYSGNVKTLVQLVNDLPEGVTKQTGAQIIRLTMEAMGISMENVLSDAQAVQSELLEAVRGNIKKIEEFKTVIRKLESEIRFHQSKANELSEIIDLFILSNTSPNMPNMNREETSGY